MKDDDVRVTEKLRELERRFGVTGIAPLGGGLKQAACASFRREEKIQLAFLVVFQLLVLILAIATLALLVWALYEVAVGNSAKNLLSGVGAVVTGAGTYFLSRQRTDARVAHKAAQKGLEKHCK
jgi:hypothetical protein